MYIKKKNFSWLRLFLFVSIIILPCLTTLLFMIVIYIENSDIFNFKMYFEHRHLISSLRHFGIDLRYTTLIITFVAYPLFTYICPYIYRKYNWAIFEDTVMEYTITIKILEVLGIILLILINFKSSAVISHSTIYSSLTFNTYQIILQHINPEYNGQPIEIRIPGILPFIVYSFIQTVGSMALAAAFIKLIFLITRKDFRVDFAIGCIKLIPKSRDEKEKIKWLIKGLHSYNLFTNKQLKININIFKIYSKIINSPLKERNDSIQAIYNAFEGDKLEIINQLSKFFHDNEKEQFLTMNSFQNRLQQLGTNLGWLITAIIGIIGAITTVITIVIKSKSGT